MYLSEISLLTLCAVCFIAGYFVGHRHGAVGMARAIHAAAKEFHDKALEAVAQIKKQHEAGDGGRKD